jgi:hypothetical protein
MDAQRAKHYCHAAWLKIGSPTEVDVDDLIQEFLLAELEGLEPTTGVSDYLSQTLQHSKLTENGQKMGFVLASESDIGLTDAEQDEYLQLEREIGEEHQAERFASLYGLIDRLAKTHHQYAGALLIAASLGADAVPDVAIAAAMNVSQRQAKHLRLHGLTLLWNLAHPKAVKLPLFELEDEVATLTVPYEKRVKYIGVMADVILGTIAQDVQ